MPRQHILTLDLRDDPALIAEYEAYHAAGAVWPEVVASIREAGIRDMRIYRLGTRLVMVMEVEDGFSFEAKAARDAANPVVQRWERLMERFQHVEPGAEGGKWQPMAPIFALGEQ